MRNDQIRARTGLVIASLACFSILATVCQAAEFDDEKAANWHQWRGPNSTGFVAEADPPTTWSEETNVKWKVAIPGRGSATPVIWGDRVYLLTAIKTEREEKPAENAQNLTEETQPVVAIQPPSRQGGNRGRGRGGRGFGRAKPTHFYQFVVMCLDRETGETIWKKVAAERVPHESGHRTNSQASGSPITDGKHVWASFGSHGIFCYTVDGEFVWKQDLGEMRTRNGFGEGTSPTLYGDNLIVNWDHEGPSFIRVLDAKTGETRWNKERDEPTTWNTPLVVVHDGVTQVIVNGTNRTRSYNLENGDIVWECGGQATNPISCPVTLDGVVFCMTGHRGFKLTAIPLDSKGDLGSDEDKLAWSRDKSTSYVPSPLLYGDRLYFLKRTNAILTCLNATTGEEIYGEERLEGISSIYASPVGASDRVYITGRGGTTLVLKHGDELEVLATNKLDDPIDASPAIVGKQMFLRGAEHLYCLEEE